MYPLPSGLIGAMPQSSEGESNYPNPAMGKVILYLDEKIFFFFQRLQNHSLDFLLARPTVLGEALFLLSVISAFILLLDRKGPFGKIGVLSVGVLMTQWVAVFLKDFFKRPRPYLVWDHVHVIFSKISGYAFPSGHTTAVFGAAFLLNALYGKNMKWTYAVAAWVGMTRIYVGVHYPSDVLGGALVGVACAAVCFSVSKRRADAETGTGADTGTTAPPAKSGK